MTVYCPFVYQVVDFLSERASAFMFSQIHSSADAFLVASLSLRSSRGSWPS